MKALIAIDGSPESTDALQTAVRVLNADGREMDLFCVAPRFSRRSENRARSERYKERALREITQILEQARSGLLPEAGVVRLVTAIGSPSGLIVKKASDYDVTVIGPKGRGSTGGPGLGPVASRVVEYASSPVLIARRLETGDGLRVLAAVDGSEASLRSVEMLGRLCDLTSAEVCLMHVAETPWIELGPEEDWITYSEEDKEHSETGELEKELVREGEAVIEEAREFLAPYRAAVTTRVVEGDPTNEILSEADRGEYDLVVVGATGIRDLKHRMLGSVSTKLAWNAPCSVLIVSGPQPLD